jgi:hypothetical protein
MTSSDAARAHPTSLFAVVVYRLVLLGRRVFAACSPPADWLVLVVRNDAGTVFV